MLQNLRIHSSASAPIDLHAIRTSSLNDLVAYAESEATERPHYSAQLYKIWIDSNRNDPLLYAALFNFSTSLARAGDPSSAIMALRECIRLKPDFAAAYINLGRVLEDSGETGAAVSEWLTLIRQLDDVKGSSVKNKLVALQQTARVLLGHGLQPQAEDALKQSLEIEIRQPEVIQHWVDVRQGQCIWPLIENGDRASARVLIANMSPLSLMKYVDDPIFQLARNYRYNKEVIKAPAPTPRRWSPPSEARSSKLRIGFVSSDLREHAVGFAMTDILEEHDKASFEIHAYYCGVDRTDAIMDRIKKSVDKWVDINKLSDEEASERIVRDKIDILIDVNGYTQNVRMRLFSLRPAPIVANWFGFPGTMGTSYHHYIISDENIISKDDEIYYSEKVLRLPCYQANDRKRFVAERPSRADENLPPDAFVFCCLNGLHKTTHEVFLSWLEIIKNVDGSVLWLLGSSENTNGRVREIAEKNGVRGDRLIFAEKRPNPQHLARYALADLFLDTFPYGAHTTASDSLFMGVPVLTVRGQTFASRVCSSVVRAAGLPELVCPDHDSYVAKAVALGRAPNEVDKLKSKLRAERDTCLLFNIPLLVRELENLYRGMWEDYKRGALPKPDLRNLDAYHEIGLDLHLGGVMPASLERLRERYTERLEVWNETWPLVRDTRLWRRD